MYNMCHTCVYNKRQMSMSILAFKILTKGDWVKEMYILDIKSNRTMNFILGIIIILEIV